MTKFTISGQFLGIFEIFKRKGTPNHKPGKIHLFDILPPQQSRQLCLEEDFFILPRLGDGLSKKSKSQENVKRAKLTISYLYKI
jgi:hypothetical protein